MKTSFKHAKILTDKDSIITEVEVNNISALNSIIRDSDSALLIEKIITFADVRTNRKKAYLSTDKTRKGAFSEDSIKARASLNVGFYLSTEEIVKFEKKHKKNRVFFNQTKQNSIYIPSIFYSFLGIPNATTHLTDKGFKQYLMADKGVQTFIVNDSVKNYFSKELTENTYKVLNKNADAKELNLADGQFSLTPLHITPHGLGTTEDGLFEALRENLFAKDKIIIVCIKKGEEKAIYISTFRNPKFFILNKLFNKDYLLAKYGEEKNNKSKDEGRVGQAKWRDELAELSIGKSAEDSSFVTCPFTGVKVQYPEESAFLRASHIKAYSKCKNADGTTIVEEAYDVENGFLVIADVDALFDKYLLTVNPETNDIIKSPILTSDVISHLNLKNKISETLSEEKKKYLYIHYNEFKQRNGLV